MIRADDLAAPPDGYRWTEYVVRVLERVGQQAVGAGPRTAGEQFEEALAGAEGFPFGEERYGRRANGYCQHCDGAEDIG